jgi:DNA-binding MarR family transcriptional regulator
MAMKEVSGILECELWESYRKFSNEKITSIAKLLYKKPLTFSEIRDQVNLDKNNLNHYLITMRNAHIIKKIKQEPGRSARRYQRDTGYDKYSLTRYGLTLLEASETVKELIKDLDEKEIFKATSYKLCRTCMDRLLDADSVLAGEEGNKMREAMIIEAKCAGLSVEDTAELFKTQPDFDLKKYTALISEIWSKENKSYSCERLQEACKNYVSPYCKFCRMIAEPITT